MSEAHPSGGDAAAYALGALEPAEADAFAVHLESCAICRDEVAAFQRVVDALPMSAPPVSVPRGLRRRVLGAVNAQARPSGLSWLHQLRLTGGFVPRPALALSALVLVVIATIGAVKLAPSSSPTRVIQAKVVGPSGSAELRVRGERGELILHHMPPPPAGHIYEIWVRRPPQPPSPTSALFSVTSSGAADVGVPGNLHGVKLLMVTQEPAGGSKVPTHSPLLLVHLA